MESIRQEQEKKAEYLLERRRELEEERSADCTFTPSVTEGFQDIQRPVAVSGLDRFFELKTLAFKKQQEQLQREQKVFRPESLGASGVNGVTVPEPFQLSREGKWQPVRCVLSKKLRCSNRLYRPLVRCFKSHKSGLGDYVNSLGLKAFLQNLLQFKAKGGGRKKMEQSRARLFDCIQFWWLMLLQGDIYHIRRLSEQVNWYLPFPNFKVSGRISHQGAHWAGESSSSFEVLASVATRNFSFDFWWGLTLRIALDKWTNDT